MSPDRHPEKHLPAVRGWCPGAWQPMQSGDGWLLRLRPSLGRLEPEQGRELAALGVRYGNGLFDLTSRGALQIRGLSEAGIAPLQQALVALGLIETDPEREHARNVLFSPLWQQGDATHQIGAALEEALLHFRFREKRTSEVDISSTRPGVVNRREASRPTGRAGAQAYAISASCRSAAHMGGRIGKGVAHLQTPLRRLPDKFGFSVDCGPQPALAWNMADIRLERDAAGQLVCRPSDALYARPVSQSEAAGAALELAQWFLESGGAGRMKAHLEEGAVLPEGYVPFKPAAPALPLLGLKPQGFLAAFAFGQLTSGQLHALADLAPLRLTPWRMLLLEGVNSIPDIEGLIASPKDPMRRVIACPGAPACPQAHGETRELATRLAPVLPPGTRLHVSGCQKSCAHPHPANLTLVAAPSGGYDLIRGGHAADMPERTATPVAALPGLLSDMFHEE